MTMEPPADAPLDTPLGAPLAIPLSADEALVLFDLLSRYEQDERLPVADPAEAHVLARLLGALERHLVAPFDARYPALLAGARSRVLGPAEPDVPSA